MMQNFVQIGNSKGIIIPKALLKQLGFKPNQKIWVEPDIESQVIVISQKEKPTKQITSSPRLIAILDKVNKEYGPALKKLATL